MRTRPLLLLFGCCLSFCSVFLLSGAFRQFAVWWNKLIFTLNRHAVSDSVRLSASSRRASRTLQSTTCRVGYTPSTRHLAKLCVALDNVIVVIFRSNTALDVMYLLVCAVSQSDSADKGMRGSRQLPPSFRLWCCSSLVLVCFVCLTSTNDTTYTEVACVALLSVTNPTRRNVKRDTELVSATLELVLVSTSHPILSSARRQLVAGMHTNRIVLGTAG